MGNDEVMEDCTQRSGAAAFCGFRQPPHLRYVVFWNGKRPAYDRTRGSLTEGATLSTSEGRRLAEIG